MLLMCTQLVSFLSNYTLKCHGGIVVTMNLYICLLLCHWVRVYDFIKDLFKKTQ
jgi:hypothetical protein